MKIVHLNIQLFPGKVLIGVSFSEMFTIIHVNDNGTDRIFGQILDGEDMWGEISENCKLPAFKSLKEMLA